jgi:2-oxoglutarate dehydrogenase E1 component
MSSSVSPRLNADLMDELYVQWKQDPRSLEPNWSAFFEGFELGQENFATPGQAGGGEMDLALRSRVVSMIYNYRILGHTQAWLDPLSNAAPVNERLSLEELGFSEADLKLEVQSQFFGEEVRMTLGDMIERLKSIYCDWIGFEFMHIHNTEVRHWLRDRIEGRLQYPSLSAAQQQRVLRWLVEAESFEQFLHRKYVGQKRFGLDGGESLMVALGTIFEASTVEKIDHLVMGMAHRGRLNVLANFLRKPLKVILYEFSENYVPNIIMGDGDVKYHLGFETVRTTEGGTDVGISLAANPSHLEAVNAVVEGKARARQRAANHPDDEGVNRDSVVPILIHGDAAFAGQGSVAEVLNLSQLPGYRTGGTIHLIINNQIGFTTTPDDARSSAYCTDVAKMIEAPVFHVNGDKPLEVAFVTQLALEFRQRYNRDVVIDIVCYRRHGHNEGDEPAFTLPDLYRNIGTHPEISDLFAEDLIARGIMDQAAVARLHQEYETRITEEHEQLKEHERKGEGHVFAGSTAMAQPPYSHDPFPTGIEPDWLRHLGHRLTTLPEGFQPNEKLDKRFLGPRREAAANGGPFNWAFAESLAFGSLLLEGTGVRLSGQDCRRGTFSQRHAVLYNVNNRERHFPLRHVAPEGWEQARFYVYNSLLSEAAVLGFDYGYSIAARDMLVLWEAQFGDFANGAQVIIDQFICSAESKWQQPSNIVLLLPHGYEGMGPEHSSARLERFLQLGADNNIQVCYPSTPAQYFHLLRRQANRPVRKPLVVMTPKSLLGNPECVSFEADMTGSTSFQEIIDDPALPSSPEQIDRVILCSGKVFYDLMNYRRTHEIKNTAIVRVEQFYPFNRELMVRILHRYFRENTKIVWCQEEPKNMGGWGFIAPRLREIAYETGDLPPRYAGRHATASPAAGAKAIHVREQAKLLEDAFGQ